MRRTLHRVVLKHFQGVVISFDAIAERLDTKTFDGLYLVGGYPDAWLDESVLSKLSGLSTLIVQDILNSPLTDMATIVLASGTFAERQGTVVNHSGLAQEVQQSIRSAPDVRPDGRLLFELSQRQGMYNAASIRTEMAKEVPAFAVFASGIGELGIQLFTIVEGKSA